MNTNTTIQRIESANTVPSAETLPIGTWSADDLLTRIDERSHTVTDLQTSPRRSTDTSGAPRWRGPILAVGVAVAIFVVGVLGFVVGSRSDSPVGSAEDSDPAGVVTEYLARFTAGDARYVELLGPTAIDAIFIADIGASRYMAATGMELDADCDAQDSIVTCRVGGTSGLDRSIDYSSTGAIVFDVDDGRITSIAFTEDYQPIIDKDKPALGEYAAWVRREHPDKFGDLFVFGTTLATQTDELVRLQQQMIAQYHEATGTG
jgi:hypothetical protein